MANLLSSPLMRSSYPSSDKSSRLIVLRPLERFLIFVNLFEDTFCRLGMGRRGKTLTARIVFPLDDVLLSTDTLRDEEDRAESGGRIVLELSSEILPVKAFGGESFRGDGDVFFGEYGGNGGRGAELVWGERSVNPPSKSLSQSSSSVAGDDVKFDRLNCDSGVGFLVGGLDFLGLTRDCFGKGSPELLESKE